MQRELDGLKQTKEQVKAAEEAIDYLQEKGFVKKTGDTTFEAVANW